MFLKWFPETIILVVLFVLPQWALATQPSFVSPEGSTALFKHFKAHYDPIVQAAGGEFILQVNLENKTVAASANRDIEDKYVITIDMGMLVSERVTLESLRLTLCHEMGHLLGGVPHRSPPSEWTGPLDPNGQSLISAEGQADYYATTECFKKIVSGEDHRSILQGKTIPFKVRDSCSAKWGSRSEDFWICQRAALASFEFLTMVKEFAISFDTPDPKRVEKTIINEYPARQCRLDTLFAGALSLERPGCWFKSP